MVMGVSSEVGRKVVAPEVDLCLAARVSRGRWQARGVRGAWTSVRPAQLLLSPALTSCAGGRNRTSKCSVRVLLRSLLVCRSQ